MFSPDGQRIVTASWDDTARVWKAADGQLLVKLEGHENRVVHAACARRAARRHGQRRQDRRGYGTQLTANCWPNWKATGTLSSRRRSRAAVNSSLLPARTIRRGCGTRPTANCWPSSKATRTGSGRRRSRPTASASSPPAGTRRRGSTVWSRFQTLPGYSDSRAFGQWPLAFPLDLGQDNRPLGTPSLMRAGLSMKRKITLKINGKTYSHDVEPRLLLIHYLREVAGLTGPHIGCETSICGACTVEVDGKAVKAAPCSPCRPTARASSPSKVWPPTASCIRCRRPSGMSTACSAVSVRRA